MSKYSTLEKPFLDFRWKFANEKNADYLISIHCNSVDDEKKSGFLILYDSSTNDNIKLATTIISTITCYGTNLKNHRYQELRALRGFKNQAILIELGFLSNNDDLLKMTAQSDNLALEIALGLKKYIDEKK